MQAFGPILGPAFIDNFEARIHLTAALNNFSRKEIKSGFTKMALIKDMCSCDEDCAAWFFFMGLGFEVSGMEEEMLRYYRECIKYEPHFSLPYLMIAKCAHKRADFDYAEENYIKAISYIENENLPPQTRLVLASVYTNYFSCLTSMGKYSAAEAALKRSEELLPVYPQRLHYACILYAYMENSEKLSEYLEKLKNSNTELYKSTKDYIDGLII